VRVLVDFFGCVYTVLEKLRPYILELLRIEVQKFPTMAENMVLDLSNDSNEHEDEDENEDENENENENENQATRLNISKRNSFYRIIQQLSYIDESNRVTQQIFVF
jgi:hypothetical protein